MNWLPIETAPKDGTTVLLLVPTTWCKWNDALPLPGWWEERGDDGGFWIIFNADEEIQRVDATHWMQLPKDP